MNRFIVIALLLLTAGLANADIVATAGSISIDVSVDTTTPASPGLTAYVVTLNSDLGVSAVDGRIDATTGYLNQSWFYGVCSTPTTDGAYPYLSSQDKRDDTHIIVPIGNMLAERAPDEDLVSGHNGTTLCGAWNANTDGDPDDDYNDYSQTMILGFKDLTNYTSIPFARIVLATNAVAEFDFTIAAGGRYDGEEDSFDFSIPTPQQQQIPEPMTFSVLALGGLSLLRKRK